MGNTAAKFALNLTISYASLYGFVILITSIVCAFKVRQMRRNKKKTQSKAQLSAKSTPNAPKNDSKTSTEQADDEVKDDITIEIEEKTSTAVDDEATPKCTDAVKEWFKLVKQKKSVYISLIPHIFDQATDFGVIYQYYELWDKGEDIGSANPMYFFVASCFVVILHRIASSIAIYKLTRKCSDVLLQIFDLMMIKAIWVNYKLNKDEKANPQRYLEILEATFESGPQLLISTAFILKASTSDSHEITILIMVSVIFSLWSLTSRVTADDKGMFSQLDEDEQKLWLNHGFNCNKCSCFHWQYVLRIIIWRFFEITQRIFMCVLIWINLGGLAVSVIIGLEFVYCLVLSIYAKTIDTMSLMMYLSLNVADDGLNRMTALVEIFMVYRVVSNWIYLVLITIFAAVPFEAEQVEEYETRHNITIQSTLGLFMLMYAWITSFIWPCGGFYVLVIGLGDADNISTPRNFRALIEAYQFDDIVEIMEFGGMHKISANDVVKTDNSNSSLSKMSKYIEKHGVSVITVNLLIVFQSVIAAASQSVNDKNLLHPLEVECINDGDLLHLAIVVMMVTDDEGNKLAGAENRSTELLQEIIDTQNVDINKCNANHETPLHCLARNAITKDAFTDSDVDKARILLRNGIDKNITDKNNWIKALDIVMKRRQDISHDDDVEKIHDLSTIDEFIQLLS